MYYCFVEEDIMNLGDDDQLIIQAKYAKRLGKYCCCRLSEETIFDKEGLPIDLRSKRVLLRATCNTTVQAASLLEAHGAKLFESVNTIRAIEHWDHLSLSERQIFSIQSNNIIDNSFPLQIENFLSATPYVFIKSREKGFCVQLPSQKLLQGDARIIAFFKERSTSEIELMLSEVIGVKADSLGLKESRHFVFDGAIVNSSRPLHSIKHAVPRTLLEKATCLVKAISEHDSFPKNYVLDIGEFERRGESFFDIVELNPITNSFCYVNNSIFDITVPEALAFQTKMGMGAEYCYDAIEHPERYTQRRYTGACYEYTRTEQYIFD